MSDDNVKSFNAAKFNQKENSFDCSPIEALEAAIEWVKSRPAGEAIDHVIIFTGRNAPEGCSAHRYFQAGSYSTHAQYGLCMAGTKMLTDD